MASKYYNGMFETESFRLPSDVTLKEALPKNTGDSEAALFQKLGSFMTRNDFICKEVTINSQKYKNGDIVVLKAEDDVSLLVGVIKTILVKSGKVFFVSQRYKAERNMFNFFVSKTCSSDLVFVDRGLGIREKFEEIDTVVETDYDGSKIFKDIHILVVFGNNSILSSSQLSEDGCDRAG